MSTGADANDVRGAVTAARIGAPDGQEQLVAILAVHADHYAGHVLALPAPAAGEVAGAAVRRTLKGLPRRLDADEVTTRLELAVRTEAFDRQDGSSGSRGRVLAAAALVLVVVGFGAFALSLGDEAPGGDDTPPMSLSVDVGDTEVILDGTVVGPDGDEVGAEVAVQVRLDDVPISTARTDAEGRFRIGGLEAEVYDVRVATPDGLRLADGSTTVDLTAPGTDAVVLRLERP